MLEGLSVSSECPQVVISAYSRTVLTKNLAGNVSALPILLNCSWCSKLVVEVGIMNTASKLGPHTQTDRGTCPGVGL